MGLIKKVLIVDDDKEILESLELLLKQRHNISSVVLSSNTQVIKYLKTGVYDSVVLDLMMPGMDGHMLCREIRKISDIPLIMVSASSDVSERLLAFELGVDDFLVKPFNVNELVARLEAIHKRSTRRLGTTNHIIYHFAKWKLNTAIFQLISPENVEIALSSSDYKLLLAFLEHPNRILSRDYLVEYIQNRSRDVFDRSIDVRVSLLRKKLSAKNTQQLIKTIHNQGYILVAKVDKEVV